MIKKAKRLFWTIYPLKFSQIFCRIYYTLFSKRYKKLSSSGNKNQISLQSSIPSYNLYNFEKMSFLFLNIEKSFKGNPDWNDASNGKLWTYNLNYFEFLLQENMSKKEGCKLIDNYLANIESINVGLEPYPTSLRVINWVKFIVKFSINKKEYNDAIYSQAIHLTRHLEYHLLGNHLLENAFSLLFAGVYLSNQRLFKKAEKILNSELKEQILSDGAHFELSPMYHCIIFYRLLDGINLLRKNLNEGNIYLLKLMEDNAAKMLSWINNVSFKNGDLPLFNDAAIGIAPNLSDLLSYAGQLAIKQVVIPLSASGYHKMQSDRLEIMVKAGDIGPGYIPGHAHADTFTFIAHVDGNPFIVDTGVSSYTSGESRDYQRSTMAHNAVVINNRNSSDVWSAFRVGKRAKSSVVKRDSITSIFSHNGYLPIQYQRAFQNTLDTFIITDEIFQSTSSTTSFASLHFASEVQVDYKQGKLVTSMADIEFKNAKSIKLEKCFIADGFNRLASSTKAVVTFDNYLETRISPN